MSVRLALPALFANRCQAPVSAISTATISIGSVTSAGAEATVSYGSADTTAPSAVTNLQTSADSTGTSVTLTWTSATDNRGVAGYRVTRNGTALADVAGTSFSDPAVTPGVAYTYSVSAYDAAGNMGAAATATVTTTGADTTAPTAVPSLSTSVSKNRSVKLTWNAASDNVAVTGYLVLRDGVTVGAVSSLSFSQSRVPAGSYTYALIARDAAGNESPPVSRTVTVK